MRRVSRSFGEPMDVAIDSVLPAPTSYGVRWAWILPQLPRPGQEARDALCMHQGMFQQAGP